MALSKSKSCNSHGHVASLPGAHHSARAPQVVEGVSVSIINCFFLSRKEERGVGGVVFGVFFNSVGLKELLLLGGLRTAEPPHEPRVIAALCSPGGMSSICWSKPRGRGTCERPTGKPTERGIKVRGRGDGRAGTANQGKIKVSRASLMGTIHCGWPLSRSFLPSGC